MKKLIGILMVASLLCMSYSTNVLADTYCNNGFDCDYGDAPGYGVASNVDGWWQRLGKNWDQESGTLPVDASDDGVSWSVNGGAYGHSALIPGQTVKFKFDVYRSPYGGHTYDQLVAWVDWNDNKNWEPGEQIIALQWFKSATGDGFPELTKDAAGWAQYLLYLDDPSWSTQVEKSFESDAIIVPTNFISSWLRARVNCWDVPFGTMTPYGELYQGETEDYLLQVPEPSSVILLCFGLLCIAFMRRKIQIFAR
jgi:hypothetical protein